MTHTFAKLPVTAAAFDEIERKMRDAGYQHALDDGIIDMHGIALKRENSIADNLVTEREKELKEAYLRVCEKADTYAHNYAHEINAHASTIKRIAELEQREKVLDWYQDVLDFHRKFDCLINDRPTLPPENTARLRADMEREELGELHDATNDGDLVGIADAIADLIYILLGRAVSYGIDMRPVWEEVHQANMAKVGGGKRGDGKVMKPDGWEPPDIESIIASQSRREARDAE